MLFKHVGAPALKSHFPAVPSRPRYRLLQRQLWRSTSSERAQELVAWIKSNGGDVNSLEVSQSTDGSAGYCLRCTQDVTSGSRLVTLPASCQLTYDQSSDERLLNLIRQVPEELWGAKLALQVLLQRTAGPSSFFHPYLSLLPQGFPGLPMFFSREAVQMLSYLPVVEQVNKRGRWLHQFSQSVLDPIRGTPRDPYGGAIVDVNALGWGLGVVTSRAFRTRGPSHPASMLPLIDMANHSFTPNTEVKPAGDGKLALLAKKKIKAGEEILLSYGQLPNDFLLLDYGFLVDNNPFDRVNFRFDPSLIETGALLTNVMDPDESLAADIAKNSYKQRVLKGLGLRGKGANLEVDVCPGSPVVEPRFLAATRLCFTQYSSEVEGLTVERLGDWERPLNKKNEVKTLKTLSGICAFALSTFPTTKADDEALLQTRTLGGLRQLTSDELLAIRFRLGKKQLLVAAMELLGRRIKEVKAMSGLKDDAHVGPNKGGKPKAATGKGFGAQ